LKTAFDVKSLLLKHQHFLELGSVF